MPQLAWCVCIYLSSGCAAKILAGFLIPVTIGGYKFVFKLQCHYIINQLNKTNHQNYMLIRL